MFFIISYTFLFYFLFRTPTDEGITVKNPGGNLAYSTPVSSQKVPKRETLLFNKIKNTRFMLPSPASENEKGEDLNYNNNKYNNNNTNSSNNNNSSGSNKVMRHVKIGVSNQIAFKGFKKKQKGKINFLFFKG